MLSFIFNQPPDTAGYLFIAAKDAAKRAFTRRSDGAEDTEAVIAIVLCVVTAEAAINEIGEWFAFNRQRPPFHVLHDLPEGFYDMELRTKWWLLPVFMRQRSFDRGSEPWQSFEALVELRNFIIHFRRRGVSKRVKNYLEQKSAGTINFQTAAWACETIFQMFKTLTELVDPPEVYKASTWIWHPYYFRSGLSTPGNPWPPQK